MHVINIKNLSSIKSNHSFSCGLDSTDTLNVFSTKF